MLGFWLVASLVPPSIKLLIVEDEPFVRLTGADLLAEAGFEVLEAGNADEALRILETTPDVRVVFSDVEMPGSLDGRASELSSPPAIVSAPRRFRAKAGFCRSPTTAKPWCATSRKL